MESEEAKSTIEQVRKALEMEVEEARTRPLPSSSSSVSSSASSSARASSSASSEDDDDDDDDKMVANDRHSIAKSKSDEDVAGGEVVSERSLSCSASTPPEVTSPRVQKMSEYDPERIPASVFSSKPANNLDWSMASNDSLFSIHVGNNSFTKEQFRSEEQNNNNNNDSLCVSEAKSSEMCSLPSSLPPLIEVPANEEGSAKSSCVSAVEKEDVAAAKSGATPRASTESRQSCTSFAFPILDGEGGKGKSLEEEEEEVQPQDSVSSAENSTATTGGFFSWCPCLPRCC